MGAHGELRGLANFSEAHTMVKFAVLGHGQYVGVCLSWPSKRYGKATTRRRAWRFPNPLHKPELAAKA
jgi:hypothetical protein